MGRALAMHWIATTFGAWLHGDPRGSWDKGRLLGPDPFREAAIRQRMHADAMVLSDAEIESVTDAFGRVVVDHGHRIYAATVRPTHTHLVMAPTSEDIGVIIARLKRRSAAVVLAGRRRVAGSVPKSLWTRGRFIVFIDDEQHLHHVIEYVRRHNREAGLADDPYPWIESLYI